MLGTAQFGFDYGVTNDAGVVPVDEVKRILTFASDCGIKYIDTAAMYGMSETVLGDVGVQQFNIVTKLATQKNSIDMPYLVTDSLSKLRLRKVAGLLIHDVDAFLENPYENINSLMKLKDLDLVDKVGVSVYRRAQAEEILSLFTPDIIQLPMNVFDQRFLELDFLDRCKDKGIELHVRSIFLQGIALQAKDELNPYLDFFKEHFSKYEEFIKERGSSKLSSALQFVLGNDKINKVIVGICSETQLRAIVEVAQSCDTYNLKDYEKFKFHDERLINPLKWPMLKRG